MGEHSSSKLSHNTTLPRDSTLGAWDESAAPGVLLIFYYRDGTESVRLRPGQNLVVGRSHPSDLRIADATLSRTHARFSLASSGLTVTDLGSTNGTLLQGEPISRESNLRSGDDLLLGDVGVSIHQLTPRKSKQEGVEGYARVLQRLAEEVERARTFNRPLSLVMMRSPDVDRLPLAALCNTLARVLRSVDHIGVYDPHSVLLLLPEAEVDLARETVEQVSRTDGASGLLCGISSFPRSASSDQALLAACRSACLAATAEQPVVIAQSATVAAEEECAQEQPVVIDPAMQELMRLVERVAPRNMPVLITGETGVGKEVIAREIHRRSGRTGALKAVNCATIPRELTESILFGHERGAFTGANRRAHGLFEQADGGSLFLDEVGELGPDAQASLLRVLQEHRLTRLGSNREISVDVRLIAATHCDLETMIGSGRFREDLFYRLNTIVVSVPPLRERRGEIAALAARFLDKATEHWGGGARRLSPEAVALLEAFDWPGNVRQLRNIVERAAALSDRELIGPLDLPDELRQTSPQGPQQEQGPHATAQSTDLRQQLRLLEERLITQALERSRGNLTNTAALLGIPLRTLRYKMGNLGLKSRK